MFIKEVNISAFGNLKNRTIKFDNSLNLLHGPNESGKSTLFAFVKFMFFGTKIRKSQNDLPFKEKYAPWDGAPIAGSMTISDEAGKEYIISRIVSLNKNTVSVIDANTGEEIKTADFFKNVGDYFLGLSEDAFSATSFLSNISSVVRMDREGQLLSRLTNISQSGIEDVSYTNAVFKLKEEIANLSSEKRRNAVIPGLENCVNAIDTDIEKLEAKIARTEKLEADILKMKARYDECSLELEQLRKNKVSLPNENDSLKKIICDELSLLEKSEFFKFECVTDYEHKIIDNIFVNDKLKKQKNINTALIISLLLTAAGFFGFYRSFFTIFGLTGILLTFILVLCKKRLKKLIIDCKKQLDDILNKYECQNTEEFKNGLRAYDNVIVKINLLKDELKLLDDNNKIMEFNVTESKNKANHFTIYNNDDKIESLINESEALKRSIVISEEQLEECRRASVELENLINKRSTLLHEISNARKRLNSLNISLKVLNTAFEKLKTEFAPQLAERVGDILSVITNGKYDSVLTDEDFLVKLKSEIGYNDSLYYSRGTYEQIYIAMRFALLDIAVQDRVLPIFLDDALAFFDDDRFINILNYISAESHKRQVFVSSCHSREYIYFKNKGINIIEFSSERND